MSENKQFLIILSYLLQIITVKDSKRRLSLSNSVESEVEENEYLDVVDDFPVLSHESQLLDEYHLQKVSWTPPQCQTLLKNVILFQVLP